MAREGSWAEVNVKWEGYARIDFDKVKIRKAMRLVGRNVQRQSRKLVSRRGGVSRPGQAPSRSTGALMRSIKVKVSRPGFLVRIAPEKITAMGKDFYPAFLHYGSEKNNLKPRSNYMVEALRIERFRTQSTISSALQDALIPRK
ncbi:hypothetical protein ACW4YW_15060 [Methylobacillus pratensis]